jgi:16S rRNA (cytosine967-C5)-methyltransferase
VTPAARLAAAIEILDRIEASKLPADQVLKAWGKANRFAGSGDRRAIAERVYQALRGRARAAWAFEGDSPRALVLGSLAAEGQSAEEIAVLFSGEGRAPAALTGAERASLGRDLGEAPDWARAGVPPYVAELLRAQYGDAWAEEAAALVAERAPVDLRVNGLAGPVEGAIRLLATNEIKPERTPFSAWGLRLPAALAPDIQKTRAYTTGWIEVQDEGSQVAAFLAGAQPGWTVIDYCAGGGGKTLALAQQMRRQGRLIASDLDGRRLNNITERLGRAGAKAEVRKIGAEGQGTEDLADLCDLVLVDAPCSGSGTWRRHPEGAWRLQSATVERLAALQAGILSRASSLVRPGGRLAYVTCSIIDAENAQVAAGFAAAHPEFRPLPIARTAATSDLTEAGRARLAELADGGHTVQLTPRRAGTDGFFIALFERSRTT